MGWILPPIEGSLGASVMAANDLEVHVRLVSPYHFPARLTSGSFFWDDNVFKTQPVVHRPLN